MTDHGKPPRRPGQPHGPGGAAAPAAAAACSRQDRRFGYALIAPVVIVLLAITAYPLVYNVWNSFHHVDYLIPSHSAPARAAPTTPELFTDTSSFPRSLHTVGFTVVSVAVETSSGWPSRWR